MTPEQQQAAIDCAWERNKEAHVEALRQRAAAYAAKFVNDTAEKPTDDNIAEVCDMCVRPPRPDEYPAIRTAVEAFRMRRRVRALGYRGPFIATVLPAEPALDDES